MLQIVASQMMIVSDNCKWHLKYKYVIALPRVVNYAPGVVNYAPRVTNYAPRVMLQLVASQMMIVGDNCKCCLYYKHVIALARVVNYAPRVVNYAPRVVNYAPRVMLQLVASQMIIIYDSSYVYSTGHWPWLRKLTYYLAHNCWKNSS